MAKKVKMPHPTMHKQMSKMNHMGAASKAKKLGSKEKKAKTLTFSDPDKADRTLELSSGKRLELKASEALHSAELTSSEAKELAEKYPYLELK